MFRYVCSSNRRHAEVDTEFDCQFALLAIRIHIQGGSFNCSAQISVLKRKTLVNQRGSFVHREFHGTEYLVGCLSLFHFGTENWEEQLKNTLYLVHCFEMYLKIGEASPFDLREGRGRQLGVLIDQQGGKHLTSSLQFHHYNQTQKTQCQKNIKLTANTLDHLQTYKQLHLFCKHNS